MIKPTNIDILYWYRWDAILGLSQEEVKSAYKTKTLF